MPVDWNEFEPVELPTQVDWAQFEPVSDFIPETPRQPLAPEQLTTYGGPPKQVASMAETLAEPTEEMMNPRVTLPRFGIKETDPLYLTAGKEAANVLAGLPEFMSSNVGLAGLVGGAAAPIATTAAFTVDMLGSLGKQIHESYKNWDRMTPTQKTTAVVDMAGTGAFTALLGTHLGRGIADEVVPARALAKQINQAELTPTPEMGLGRLSEKLNVEPSTPPKFEETTALPAEKTVKEPWQMTKSEFEESRKVGRFELVGSKLRGEETKASDADAVVSLTKPEIDALSKGDAEGYPIIPQDIQDWINSGKGDVFIQEGNKLYKVEEHPVQEGKFVIERVSEKESNILAGGMKGESLEFKGRKDALDTIHKAAIEKAIQEGKPVPTEVLAEYPRKSAGQLLAEQVEAEREARTAAFKAKQAGLTAKPTTTLPKLVETLGRDEVATLVDQWEQGAELHPDGRSIIVYSDPRNQTGKMRGKTGDFLSWYEEQKSKPTPNAIVEGEQVVPPTPATEIGATEGVSAPTDQAALAEVAPKVAEAQVIDKLQSLTEKLERGEKLTASEVKQYKKLRDEALGTKEEQPTPQVEVELSKTEATVDPFERARTGEEKAFDELDAQFREIYPDEIDFGRPGRPDPNQVHTPKAFADIFNRAFAARDFDTILSSIKATSDVSIWKPFLKDLFSKQANDPIAAQKAEWFRHVFNGTVPPEAVPKPPPRTATPRPAPPVTPTPRPSAGTPPPPRPPTTPPSPPPVRILVDPIPGGGAKSPYKIIEDFSARIGKAIRVLRMKKGGLGVYRPGSTLTAERFAGDLDTAAHELAGHWTDDVHGIGKPWVTPRTRSPYDSELAKFWIHGSVKPTSTLRYRRAEGIAEYIRAYVVNPTQAKLDAPLFSVYFERTLPPDALKAIQDFSKDVRTWAGENPITRAGLNIRMEPPTLLERLWKGIRGRGFGFEVNPIDRLRQMFDDPYHFSVKADKAIQELRGKKQIPSEEFELTARLLSGHDARMSDQFENGLTPLRPGQAPNAKGTLEVERITDPVTQQPMTMKWLMDAFDKSNTDAFKKDMRDVSAYMIAQRTVEKSGQLGRDVNVSGIGAGIMTDVQAATELLTEVAKNPAQEARLKEAARRYRLWADQNIQMLVDSGRISRGQARHIRESNQQYVDMHRLSEEFEVANRAQRGGHIGTAKDLIRRFKGSSLELDNVYSNLLEQTDSIQKEAHRNLVMNNFTDGLNHVRELHGPDLKDFDQFGRKVTSADKNTIRVFKNGKGEYWQFDPAIYESLKGLGELQTNWVFNALMAPSRLARYLITRGPSFMIRNPLRDTFERSVNSRSGGKPWDIFQGYSKEELSRYESFGGGQFGNYIIDRHVWNREIKKVMREMVKDPKNILLSPLKLKHGWEALGEKSEKIGRIAEFRRAFDKGKEKIAAEHPNLTPKEVEYNAALYAAGQARGLLDFAKAGTVMKYINQAIPFSNAGLRGLAKSIQGAKENPARYAMNWGMFVLAPTLAVMMWNRRDEETWKEYLQLPSYRRDFFWNFKVGDMWMTIPKPHLLGVLAGGVERMLLGIMGEKHSMEGLGKSTGNALPVSNLAESSGPLKMFLELSYNRDSFRQRDIVPDWEKDLKLELRKTEFASGAGRGIAGAINSTGLELDPRQVDYILNSMGGWGSIATSFTRKNMMPAETGLRSTGLFTSPPGTEAKDVQWVMDWARANNKTSSPDMRELRNLRTDVFEASTMKERSEAAKALRDYASDLRENIDSELEPVE